MELVDTWILINRNVKHPYPDAVHIELMQGSTEKKQMYCLTQFSSQASYRGPRRMKASFANSPVCVISDPEVTFMRTLWQQFVHEGWTRVDAATPEGCGLASVALKARKHRYGIITTRIGDYSGVLTNSEFACDDSRRLYLPSKYMINGLHSRAVFHPVTHMPRNIVASVSAAPQHATV